MKIPPRVGEEFFKVTKGPESPFAIVNMKYYQHTGYQAGCGYQWLAVYNILQPQNKFKFFIYIIVK